MAKTTKYLFSPYNGGSAIKVGYSIWPKAIMVTQRNSTGEACIIRVDGNTIYEKHRRWKWIKAENEKNGTHTGECINCHRQQTQSHTWPTKPSWESANKHKYQCIKKDSSGTRCKGHYLEDHGPNWYYRIYESTEDYTKEERINKHRVYCTICSGSWLESHSFGDYAAWPEKGQEEYKKGHYKFCSKCPEIKRNEDGSYHFMSHSLEYSGKDDTLNHTATCSKCGANWQEAHSWGKKQPFDDNVKQHRRRCSNCKCYDYESHTYLTGDFFKYIKKNNDFLLDPVCYSCGYVRKIEEWSAIYTNVSIGQGQTVSMQFDYDHDGHLWFCFLCSGTKKIVYQWAMPRTTLNITTSSYGFYKVADHDGKSWNWANGKKYRQSWEIKNRVDPVLKIDATPSKNHHLVTDSVDINPSSSSYYTTLDDPNSTSFFKFEIEGSYTNINGTTTYRTEKSLRISLESNKLYFVRPADFYIDRLEDYGNKLTYEIEGGRWYRSDNIIGGGNIWCLNDLR